MNRLISVKELSIWIGLKPKTIYSWLETEKIPYRKLGSRVLFCPIEIQIWLDTLQKGPKLVEPISRETASEMKR
jgi:predicted DNA-binding transcriptional regulator AlpA